MNLPYLYTESNEYADFNNEIGFIVHNIEKYNEGLKNVEED
jgi:hypothetical protein